MKKGGLPPPFSPSLRRDLLADVPEAVFAAEIGAGLADEPAARVSAIVPAAVAVVVAGIGIAAERHRIRVVVPAVMPAVFPVGVAAPAVPELVIAGVGISRSVVLAISVRIELCAIAGIGNHLLRHHGACERG